jgi:hypothetical protein
MKSQSRDPKTLSKSSSVGVLALHSLQEDEHQTNMIITSDLHTSSCPALFSLQVSDDVLIDKSSNDVDNVSVASTEISLASFTDMEEGALTTSSTFLEKVTLDASSPTLYGQSSTKSLAALLVRTLISTPHVIFFRVIDDDGCPSTK